MKKPARDVVSFDQPTNVGTRVGLSYFVPILLTLAAAYMLAATAVPNVRASEAADGRPLELRKIMQDLDKNIRGIADAISRKDWTSVASIAPSIGEHPQPSMAERMRILRFMGADASAFRAYDAKTYHAARALEEAAARRDASAVVSSFAALQDSCSACHQRFRKPFVEHFYGKD